MEQPAIENALKLTKIGSELELEQATSLFSRLRLSVKNDPSLKAVRNHLADLIGAYEAEHWSDEEAVTDEQVKSSDVAERIVQFQNQFIQQRKATNIFYILEYNSEIRNVYLALCQAKNRCAS